MPKGIYKRTKIVSKETRLNMSKVRKGKVPYITNETINKKISDTWKRKYKEGFVNFMKGKKRPDFKVIRNNPEIEKKRINAMKKSPNTIQNNKKLKEKLSKLMKNGGALKARKGNKFLPNKPETILINLIEKHNLPFNYVGDKKIWFKGENHSFNPDFLSKNPRHIIEVFGDYWHNLPKTKIMDKERLETYSKYGYKTLIVWEHELTNPNQIINKINKFMEVT